MSDWHSDSKKCEPITYTDDTIGNSTIKVTIVTVVLNRAQDLSVTLASIRRQTYRNIECIVIDGGSTDSTFDVIKANADLIDSYVSEPDDGIYDAINKGLERANGHYICVLHAGDTYAADYIQQAIELADPSHDAIIYSNLTFDETRLPAELSPAIFLHNLGVNHETFLVPKEIYRQVGRYDTKYTIAADVAWVRKAYYQNVAFKHLDKFAVYMSPNGASTAKNELQKERIIRENINAIRLYFPFLSESASRALYLYRFRENEIHYLRTYYQTIQQSDCKHPNFNLFLKSFKALILHVWKTRKHKLEKDDRVFKSRLELSQLLEIDPRFIHTESNGVTIDVMLDNLKRLGDSLKESRVVVHYVEYFSRPSETFIYELVYDLEKSNFYKSVVICDKRVLPNERPFDRLLHLDFYSENSDCYQYVIETLLDTLKLEAFVFHFAINGWRFLNRIDKRYRLLKCIYMTHGIDVFDLFRKGAYHDYIIECVNYQRNSNFTAVSDYLKDRLIEAGVLEEKIFKVSNTVRDIFFNSRLPGSEKATEVQASAYGVRLLNIGRLVPFKNHIQLLKA